MTNEFKGTINGIDFYNVKEYNEYLTELIKKGVNINAQSNTNITNVSDNDENPKCCCGNGGCCHGECKDKLAGGGYVPFFEDGDEYYLDNEKLDVDTAAKVFDEFAKTLDNKLENLCPCQLNDYLNTVSDIRGSITSDDSFAKGKCDEYEKLIKKYTEGISKIQEELEKVRNHIVLQCNYYSERVERDEQGYVVYDGNIMQEAKQALHNISYDYPKLKGYYPNIKPLAFSSLFSQAYTGGYYFPFSLEANYNNKMYICNLPDTYCHEFAHLHGYIYEDEANFLSFRACIESKNDFFIYCGYLSVLNYVENEYWSRVDFKEAFSRKLPIVNEKVIKDNIFLKEETWNSIEENALFSTQTVHDISDGFMNGSLKMNGVKDGAESYRRVVALLLHYYDGKL